MVDQTANEPNVRFDDGLKQYSPVTFWLIVQSEINNELIGYFSLPDTSG